MKNSPELDKLLSSISAFLRRYHVMLYVLTVVVGVSIAILMLNGLINSSKQTDHPFPEPARFDKQTIERIEGFTTPDKNTKFKLPPGRINPFR